MEKTRQFDFNISASGLRTVLEEAFDGAKNVEVSRSKIDFKRRVHMGCNFSFLSIGT